MHKTMKFVTSISSNDTSLSEYANIVLDYTYVESPETPKQFYDINTSMHSSPCDNCPNNPALNKFATGACHCSLNLPIFY